MHARWIDPAVKRSLPLLLVLVFVGLVVFFVLRRTPEASGPISFDGPSPPVPEAKPTLEIERSAIENEPARRELVSSATDTNAAGTRPGPASGAVATLRGRFVFMNGAPAAGVQLTLPSRISLRARSHELDLAPDSNVPMG